MEKFKKFLKVFISIVLILGVGAYFVCLGAIPNETKAFTDIVVDYLNRPLGIVFGCTITLGGLVYFFIAYTSIGNKALNYLKGIVFDTKEKVEKETEKAKEYYELALKDKEQVKVILSGFCVKVDNLTDLLAKVCETSPNAKINALGKEIVESKDTYKEQINNDLQQIDTNVNEYIEQKVDVNALVERLDQLEKVVSEYGKEKPND